ncbi:hypothetical protein PI124_g21628 [Phytophthora idaei]|nr:hypothetical protein PI125_g23428 [Phytophthora idaei]KAG3128329.1 hypothetical protein PI126_g21452 [Phytophthora idaei]KAG3233298.1 hypothetical protein PI124_g21628 [Phytophthora idaei]
MVRPRSAGTAAPSTTGSGTRRPARKVKGRRNRSAARRRLRSGTRNAVVATGINERELMQVEPGPLVELEQGEILERESEPPTPTRAAVASMLEGFVAALVDTGGDEAAGTKGIAAAGAGKHNAVASLKGSSVEGPVDRAPPATDQANVTDQSAVTDQETESPGGWVCIICT